MTKLVSKFFLFMVLILSVTFAQSKDSSKTFFSPKIKLNNIQNEIILGNEFQPLMSFTDDSSTVWMRTRMQLASFANENDPMKNNFKTSILNPLIQQYNDMQGFKELKYILGMVQAGGAAYIAYQHIKKYGFLKMK
jgi:hypothetical protein